MPYEAALIRRLGYELYTPKRIPSTGFRSGTVDFSFDKSLTIPPRHLALLNEFNFYEDEWPAEIVTILNRYFGTIFVIAHGVVINEAVDKFEGQIAFRAFGIGGDHANYSAVLKQMYGELIVRSLEAVEDRLWFAEGYDNLHEIEDAVFRRRTIYLPIGAPDSILGRPDRWSGSDRRILFVCPSIGVSPYYTAMYDSFRESIGDLPHVIVGVQEQPIDDPNVVGFVSDEELEGLYAACVALYYPSREARHIHYSPIEAAVSGTPIVFHAGSLMDRLSGGDAAGRVSTTAEARGLLERLLDGDRQLADEIRSTQGRLVS